MANNTEQIGVNHIGEIAARNKWMFRPQPIDDVGIDAQMELCEVVGAPFGVAVSSVGVGKSLLQCLFKLFQFAKIMTCVANKIRRKLV